jgi:hypothetical protein
MINLFKKLFPGVILNSLVILLALCYNYDYTA